MRRSFIVGISIDGAVWTVERGRRRVVGLRLPGWLAASWGLSISHGSFIGNSEDFRNMDGFYHSPIIGNVASEL
jgi:hypothetical protein